MSAISTERAHFYPRPPRGGRPRTDKRMFNVTANFYPRPPRGGRQFANLGEQPVKKFLSTPSARRATLRQAFAVQHYYISIHALREEGDRLADFCFCLCTDFYPRPPRGGRHHKRTHGCRELRISIHALREEGDSKNGEKHLRFCFIIKRSAQIWKSLSKNIRKNSCNLHRTA